MGSVAKSHCPIVGYRRKFLLHHLRVLHAQRKSHASGYLDSCQWFQIEKKGARRWIYPLEVSHLGRLWKLVSILLGRWQLVYLNKSLVKMLHHSKLFKSLYPEPEPGLYLDLVCHFHLLHLLDATCPLYSKLSLQNSCQLYFWRTILTLQRHHHHCDQTHQNLTLRPLCQMVLCMSSQSCWLRNLPAESWHCQSGLDSCINRSLVW